MPDGWRSDYKPTNDLISAFGHVTAPAQVHRFPPIIPAAARNLPDPITDAGSPHPAHSSATCPHHAKTTSEPRPCNTPPNTPRCQMPRPPRPCTTAQFLGAMRILSDPSVQTCPRGSHRDAIPSFLDPRELCALLIRTRPWRRFGHHTFAPKDQGCTSNGPLRRPWRRTAGCRTPLRSPPSSTVG